MIVSLFRLRDATAGCRGRGFDKSPLRSLPFCPQVNVSSSPRANLGLACRALLVLFDIFYKMLPFVALLKERRNKEENAEISDCTW